jgi:hypothetical protein
MAEINTAPETRKMWAEAQDKVAKQFSEIRLTEMEERIKQLEKHIHYPHSEQQPNLDRQNIEIALKSQAAQQQAMQGMNIAQAAADRVPMRTDVETIRTLTAFVKRLLNTEDFGHAVTFEVRQAARRALGLPEVKEYDL